MSFMKKYATITRVSVGNVIAYRASVLARFCFYTLFIYVFAGLWRAIYSGGGVSGYSYVQIVWYLIMTELIGFGCGTDIFRTMNDDVKSGGIAYMLTRPVHYIAYQLANSLGQTAVNLAAFGTLAAALGLILVGPLPGFTVFRLAPLALSMSLAILQTFFTLMLLGLSAFALEENYGLYFVYQKVTFMLGLFLPVEFLPGWLQEIAKSLPFSYAYWAPAKIFVSYTPELFWQLVPRQLMWTALAALGALGVYRLCVRRLQVNGG